MSLVAIATRPTHRLTISTSNRDQVLGWLAMIVTVLVWAAFALTTRSSGASALAFGDVALIRSLVPTLVFLPFVPSRMPMIRKAGFLNCLVISVGAGLPFFWLAVTGGAVTSAAHVSALIAGTVPIFVAAFLWIATGKAPNRFHAMALALICAGALLLIGNSGAETALTGVVALLLAAFFWTAFTIAIKQSELDPVGCAIVISVPSSVMVGALLSTGVIATNWGGYSLLQAMPYILIQGIGVSVVAILTYAFAISRLGSSKCATFGSVAPALTAVLAVPFLKETLDPLTATAIVAICAGVFLSTRSRMG